LFSSKSANRLGTGNELASNFRRPLVATGIGAPIEITGKYKILTFSFSKNVPK
jgi:hypothetical protein